MVVAEESGSVHGRATAGVETALMRILMVSHYFASHPGGIELVAGKLFQGLPGPHSHTTWAAANVSAPPGSGPDCDTLPLSTWNGVENAIGVPVPVPGPSALLALHAAVGRADVVLLHDSLYFCNMAAFLFARLRGVPAVIVQHVGEIRFRNFALNLIAKLANAVITRSMLRRADQVVFISEVTRRYFGGVRLRREPAIIFNGVDTETFCPAANESDIGAARNRLGLPRERPVALFVGRFLEKKGVPVMRLVAQSAPEITFAFAGAGPLDPAGWNLPNVRVFSGLRGATLAELYRAGDVLLLPSPGEGFPLVMQEALACGLPVICGSETATADAALAQVVRGVELIRGDDRRSAANCLAALREVMANQGGTEARLARFRFVQGRYSWEHAVRRYLEVVRATAHGDGSEVTELACGNTTLK